MRVVNKCQLRSRNLQIFLNENVAIGLREQLLLKHVPGMSKGYDVVDVLSKYCANSKFDCEKNAISSRKNIFYDHAVSHARCRSRVHRLLVIPPGFLHRYIDPIARIVKPFVDSFDRGLFLRWLRFDILKFLKLRWALQMCHRVYSVTVHPAMHCSGHDIGRLPDITSSSGDSGRGDVGTQQDRLLPSAYERALEPILFLREHEQRGEANFVSARNS
ncbi:hypothetical protein PUN28_010872 [Cardiocondyla obscurior]|uniref:Uncharacterized protein n=1 Tax=Cardiocondyla obscurior TaxID=286306 RepID=A0AAW2FNY1_9HYME